MAWADDLGCPPKSGFFKGSNDALNRTIRPYLASPWAKQAGF